MELTPEKKLETEIERITLEVEKGSRSADSATYLIIDLIRDYGEQQYTKGYATSFEDHIVKNKENGTNKRT